MTAESRPPAPLNVERLQTLLDAATQGAWLARNHVQFGNAYQPGFIYSEADLLDDGNLAKEIADTHSNDADALLIVEAVNSLPALLGELRELREALMFAKPYVGNHDWETNHIKGVRYIRSTCSFCKWHERIDAFLLSDQSSPGEPK